MAYKAALGSRNGSVIGQLASRDSAAVEAAEAGISERSNGDLKLASSPYNKTLQFQRSKSRSSVEVDYLDEIDSDNDEIVTTRNHGNGNGQAKTNGQVSKAKFSSSSSSSVKRHQGQGLLAAFRRWTGARRGSEDISSDTIALIASTQDLAYDDDSMDEES
jgi:hypothetical protein